MTGKAEAGATVVVKKGTIAIGSAVVRSKGIFTVSIPVQKAGTVLNISAKDKEGNESRKVKVVVKK